MAEALTGRAVVPLSSWYERLKVVREMAGGDHIEAEADRHPDAMAEAIRWQVAEGELVQIIGRGRGVNREEASPLDVLVLCDVPVPVPVNATITREDIAPTPADLMLAAGGGEPASRHLVRSAVCTRHRFLPRSRAGRADRSTARDRTL